MGIKLYIFDSVEELKDYESAARKEPAKPLTISASPEEPHEDKPKRHYKKRKENPEKEAFKERIIAKAKGSGRGSQPMSGRTRHACGQKGHRSDHCPNPGSKKERPFGESDPDELI